LAETAISFLLRCSSFSRKAAGFFCVAAIPPSDFFLRAPVPCCDPASARGGGGRLAAFQFLFAPASIFQIRAVRCSTLRNTCMILRGSTVSSSERDRDYRPSSLEKSEASSHGLGGASGSASPSRPPGSRPSRFSLDRSSSTSALLRICTRLGEQVVGCCWLLGCWLRWLAVG